MCVCVCVCVCVCGGGGGITYAAVGGVYLMHQPLVRHHQDDTNWARNTSAASDTCPTCLLLLLLLLLLLFRLASGLRCTMVPNYST